MNTKLINIGLGEYGVTELKGNDKHHPRILEYFKVAGHKRVKTDETAWCSAFANWLALRAGCLHSGALNARSWLKVGKSITKPRIGDVVVFWREAKRSWKGHVGFYIGMSDDKQYIYCLGGNQNNQVCIKPYPVSRLLGYRDITKPECTITKAA